MITCDKCGRILQPDDEFCPKCGTPVQDMNNILDFKSDGTPRTREESIELAEELANKYEVFNNAKTEIEDLEHKLKVTKLSDVRPRYHTFRFFWKYFIFSYLAAIVALFIGLCIVSSNGGEGSVAFAVLLPIVVYIGVLILGGVLSSRKANNLNIELEINERRLHEKRRQMEKDLEERKNELNEANSFLFSYNRRIPSTMRNKHRMRKAKEMLSDGKAETLSQAVALCSPGNRNA